MFDHVTIRVADRAASVAFYRLALGDPSFEDEWAVEWGDFSLVAAEPAAVTRRLHVGFGAPSRQSVDAWWAQLVAAGYRSDGEPGERPAYRPTYYGAFVLDPDGNSVEAVHHDATVSGHIDHVWLRTTDVDRAAAFYGTVAPVVGVELRRRAPDHLQLVFPRGSCSFVAGDEPTRNVHLAFGVRGHGAVEEFHRLALAAGHRDNGAPGERPRYHPGYYGAFVLDPDGHNVEAVDHGRHP